MCIFTCVRVSSVRIEVRGVSHPADQLDPSGLTRKEKNKVTMIDSVGGSGWVFVTPHPLPHLGS